MEFRSCQNGWHGRFFAYFFMKRKKWQNNNTGDKEKGVKALCLLNDYVCMKQGVTGGKIRKHTCIISFC